MPPFQPRVTWMLAPFLAASEAYLVVLRTIQAQLHPLLLLVRNKHSSGGCGGWLGGGGGGKPETEGVRARTV
jgi:hypothetical protein